MSTDLLTWKEVLGKLKKEGVFVSLEEDYQDEWEFFDLLRRSMNYKGFKQACAGKSFSKNFRECIDKYIKLANQAEKVASKYFGKKNVKLQAYYTEVENTYRVLNINLINYNRSEPIGISDILQQEKDTNELNIYCNKKHEIHAYRKGKERHYKFKEGVRYEMTSTWYVQDKSGSTAMCTMIMNISNNGITEILQFNGENFVPSEKILELIKQNDELYIQELPLHGAVMRFLESSKAASNIVPIANSDLQCDKSVSDNQGIGHRKEVNNLDLSNGAPALFVTSSDASTQTEVDLQSIATQKEKEIDLQHIETQTEVSSQQIGGLISDNCMLMGENAELMELNERLEYGIILSLRNKLEEKEQENVKLQAELNQTKEELTSMLKEMEKRLQSMHEKKEGLEENLRNIKEAMKRGEKQLIIVKGDNEALCESNNKLRSIKEQRDQEKARLQAKLAQKNEELSSLQEENKQEYESMSEVINNLRKDLKMASTENEKLKKDVRFFEEDAEEGCILMQKMEKCIKSLEFQVQELENELEFVKRKKEQFKEEAEDEIDGLGLQEESEVDGLEWETVPLNLTSDEFDVFELVRKNEELNRKLKELKEIIEDTAQTICRMECESQSDKEEVKCLKDQIEALDKNTCHEQRKFNDQFYTITPNVFNSSPPKKRKFSESSNDSAYNSDDEDGSLFCSSVMERVSHQQMYGKKCKGEC